MTLRLGATLSLLLLGLCGRALAQSDEFVDIPVVEEPVVQEVDDLQVTFRIVSPDIGLIRGDLFGDGDNAYRLMVEVKQADADDEGAPVTNTLYGPVEFEGDYWFDTSYTIQAVPGLDLRRDVRVTAYIRTVMGNYLWARRQGDYNDNLDHDLVLRNYSKKIGEPDYHPERGLWVRFAIDPLVLGQMGEKFDGLKEEDNVIWTNVRNEQDDDYPDRWDDVPYNASTSDGEKDVIWIPDHLTVDDEVDLRCYMTTTNGNYLWARVVRPYNQMVKTIVLDHYSPILWDRDATVPDGQPPEPETPTEEETDDDETIDVPVDVTIGTQSILRSLPLLLLRR